MIGKILRKKPVLITLILLLVAATAAPSVYFYKKYTALSSTLPGNNQKEDLQTIISKVSKLILLPTGENPTVMTVTDKEKLSGQEFFTNAKNGDRVLIYEKAKKAFLYDPIADKIIEVGPVLLTSPTPGTSSITPTASPKAATIKFVLYNGTTTVGLTKKYGTVLTSKVANADILDTDTAKKRTYPDTLLVDLSGNNASPAAQIAKTLGISVGSLPAGEKAPPATDSAHAADFLIIVGADQK